CPFELFGEFEVGDAATDPNIQPLERAIELGDLLVPMHWDADRRAFIRTPSRNGLSHPVSGVDEEAITTLGIKSPCGTLQTHERHLEHVLWILAFLHVPRGKPPHVRQML